MSRTRVVTVVLPSVPVMASSGRSSHHVARSNSDSTGTPAAPASANTGWRAGQPRGRQHGVGRATSAASSVDGRCLDRTSPRSSAAARAAGPGASSAATTPWPRAISARATAAPVTPEPDHQGRAAELGGTPRSPEAGRWRGLTGAGQETKSA